MTTATETPAGAPAAIMIDLDRIETSKSNPRLRFDPKHLAELTESIRRMGVLQPVVVRPNPKGLGVGYELVAGEKRIRAARSAGLTEIPACIRDLSDDEVLEVQIVENAQRSDVHPLEEAAAFRRLLDTERYSVARIAERIGRSVAYVYDRVRLLDLTPGAQDLFLEDKISAGHAIILARLKPADQEKALDPDNQAVFQNENLLWKPDDEQRYPAHKAQADVGDSPDETNAWLHLKTRTAKELQGWVDTHVRFDTAASDLPDLFPETASTLAMAKDEADKVISITYEYHVPPEAKDGTRVFGPRSWKRADGDAKHCDHSVTGVIVIGPGRGEAFKVCTEKKKCPTHWGKEMRDAQKAAKATAGAGHEARMNAEREAERKRQERIQLERKAFDLARPEILTALAEGVKAASGVATGPLAKILGFGRKGGREEAMIPAGKTADDVVRQLAWRNLLRNSSWWNRDALAGDAKTLGVDITAIIRKHLPAPEKPAKERPKTTARKASGKPAKKGAPKRDA